MSAQRDRIIADLTGRMGAPSAELVARGDAATRALYAADASIFASDPLVVIRPRSAGDISHCVGYAEEHGLPLHPRGAGCGLAGGALGPGIVLDLTHAMRKIEWDGALVHARAGATIGAIHRRLRPLGLRLPLPAAASPTQTIGGLIAADRACVRRLFSSIQGFTAITRGGETITWPRTGANPQRSQDGENAGDALARFVQSGDPRLAAQAAFATLGHGDVPARPDDLRMILLGSEGSLAIFCDVVLRPEPIPAARCAALILCEGLGEALHIAERLASCSVAECELLDRRWLAVARESDPRYELAIPASTEAAIVVLAEGDSFAAAQDSLEKGIAAAEASEGPGRAAQFATDDAQTEFFWRLITKMAPRLAGVRGRRRPIPLIDDVFVPPQTIAACSRAAHEALREHGVTAALAFHAVDRHFDLRPLLDLRNDDQLPLLRRLAVRFFPAVTEAGGVVGGAGSFGLSRSWAIAALPDDRYRYWCGLKRLCDPQNVLNPAKVVWPDAEATIFNRLIFRQPKSTAQRGSTPARSETSAPALAWRREDLMAAAALCNGCGICRTTDEGRMCPVFRAEPREEASPRAKATLFRAALSGVIAGEALQGDRAKAIADLCFHCHQCRLECPSEVDIPGISLETKAAYVAENGTPASERLAMNMSWLIRWGGAVWPVANWALKNNTARWLMERLIGLSRHRQAPPFARHTFIRIAGRRGWRRPDKAISAPGRKALLFVDTFHNWFDIGPPLYLARLLTQAGVSVYVPDWQRPSGMNYIAVGAMDRATELARRNVARLADAVRNGYQIITMEPTAALCLTHEYPKLLGGADAALVAESSFDATAYVWNLVRNGVIPNPRAPIDATVLVHQPCHQKALPGPDAPAERLLRRVPGLDVRAVELGCSGMAGVWGLMKKNFRASLRIGRPLASAVRDPAIHATSAECSACRLQLAQGVSKPSLHPLRIFASASGVGPPLELKPHADAGNASP